MSTTDVHAPRTPRRVHPWNLAFGLLFLTAAGTWAALENDVVEGYEVGRILAWALIALGVVGIAGTVLVTRRGASVPTPTTHRDAVSDTDTGSDADTDADTDARTDAPAPNEGDRP